MSGARLALLLGSTGFVAALLANLPLRWVAVALPRSVECASPSGMLWQGGCAALRIGSTAIGSARWRIDAAQLIRFRVGGDFAIEQPGLTAAGHLSFLPTGSVEARDVTGELLLGYAFTERMAPNLRGGVALRADRVVVANGWIRDLRGELRISDLQQTYPQSLALGNYRVVFADPPTADGRLVGRLTDAGGPLDVRGTLTLLPQRGYELAGTVAARPDASPILVNQIRFLGSSDASGRRSFSQSETF